MPARRPSGIPYPRRVDAPIQVRYGRGVNTPYQPLQRAIRWAVRALGALAVLAHVALLWDRFRADELRDPQVAGRWILSAAFVAVAWQLWRIGLISFRGKRALVFWLAVILLHAAFLIPADLEAQPWLLATPGWLSVPMSALALYLSSMALLLTAAFCSPLTRPSYRRFSAECIPLFHGGFGSAWTDRGPPAFR